MVIIALILWSAAVKNSPVPAQISDFEAARDDVAWALIHIREFAKNNVPAASDKKRRAPAPDSENSKKK